MSTGCGCWSARYDRASVPPMAGRIYIAAKDNPLSPLGIDRLSDCLSQGASE